MSSLSWGSGQPLDAQRDLASSARLWWSQWWPHRRAAVGMAWLVTVVGCAALPWAPQRYESRARVFVETAGAAHEGNGSWNAAGEADRQIRVLAKSVTAGPELDRLVDLFGQASAAAGAAQREAIVAGLLSRIRLVADEPGLYTISYRDTDQQRSRQVVDGVVDLFMSVGQRQRQREAQRVLQVLEEQTRLSDQRLAEARQRLEAFMRQHSLQIPAEGQDIASRRAALQDSVSRLRAEVRAAEQVRQAYRDELAQEASVKASVLAPPGAGGPLPGGLHRLGDNHPEVIAARQASEAGPGGSGATAPQAGPDALQQRFRASLADASAQVALLRARLSAEESKLAQWRKPFEAAPALESEWQQLRLDWETAQKNHEALMSKTESSSIAWRADSDPQARAVRVVEPARAHPAVLFPARFHLAMGVAALALAVAMTASLWMQGLRPQIRNALDLHQALGQPVLGQVPWQSHRADSRSWAPGLWVLALVGLVAVHAVHLTWWGMVAPSW